MIFLFDFPPPAIYDYSYSGPGSTLIMPLAEVQKTCTNLGVKVAPGQTIYGCSWVGPICTIILPEVKGEISKADQDMVRRSENANCNGWPKGNRE